MLKRHEDRRSLTFIAAYYAALIASWRVDPIAMSAWGWIVIPILCAQSWISAVITHNTLHCAVFQSRWANKIFQILLTCSYGFPVSEYVPGHNLSHHRYTQTRKDVMRTSKSQAPFNLLSFLLFVPRVAPGVTRANYAYASRLGGKVTAWKRQLALEVFFCWGSKIVLLAIDWRKALLYVVVPHLWAVWGITAVNYLQHDGCDPDHAFNHSRNFVGNVFNWFTFNNGYHGIHHQHPGLHWSLLPEAHRRELGPHIHPALEQPSLLRYLFRTFVMTGKRVRYDGTPLPLFVEGPDEDWIPNRAFTEEEQELSIAVV